MRARKLLSLSLSLLLLAPASALAHGGVWRGPGGTPTGRVPADPTPRPDWPTTWSLNRERLLDLRGLQRERVRAKTSRDGVIFFGEGEDGAAESPGNEEARRAREAILETLRKATRDDDADVATGAVIALGKSGDRGSRGLLMDLVTDRKAHRTVNESAALALGMLGDRSREVRVFLEEVAADRRHDTRTRAFAAIGLGFLGDPGAVPALMQRARAKESHRDVPACAVIALGLLGDEIVIPDLSRALGGREKDDLLRAHYAGALAALRSRAGLPALAAALRDKDTQVRRQAALGVGPIATEEDKEVIRSLLFLLKEDRDDIVQSFAAISLGEIGAPETVEPLLAAWKDGNNTTAPHAALGLAFLARDLEDGPVRERIVGLLRREFRESGNVSRRGALAIAVGITGDRSAVKDLVVLVRGGGEAGLRSHAAMALGLLGAEGAIPFLREVLTEKASPDLQREAALALGLLGDGGAVRILLDLVANGSSDYVRGSAAVAVGRLADYETAEALRKLVEDRKRTDATRAFAAVALGLVLDRHEVPILSRVGDHLNYSMVGEAIREILTLL
jgi:HEAT repeat protein